MVSNGISTCMKKVPKVGGFIINLDFYDSCQTLIDTASYNDLDSFNINPNSLDNKGSWRILKDFYCSVTMLRELELTAVRVNLL